MSAIGPLRLLIQAAEDQRLGAAAVRVLALLIRHANNQTGACAVYNASIGAKIGAFPQAISRQIQVLKEFQYLEVVGTKKPDGSAGANEYRILFQAPVTSQHEVETVSTPSLDPSQHEVVGVSTPSLGNKNFRKGTSELSPEARAAWKAICEAAPWRKPETSFPAAGKAFKGAVKEGATLNDMVAGARAYGARVRRENIPPDKRRSLQRFITDQHWIGELEASKVIVVSKVSPEELVEMQRRAAEAGAAKLDTGA